MNRTYLVFGDSHVWSIQPHRRVLGKAIPATAHNLIRQDSATQAGNTILQWAGSLRPADHVSMVLCFGEIDCRLHIYLKHRMTRRPIGELIQTTVTRYSDYINNLRGIMPRLAVLTPPPQGHQENVYGYPHYGSMHDRGAIATEFHSCLVTALVARAVPYVDLFQKCSDTNGNIAKEWQADGVHVKVEIGSWIIEQLDNIPW